MIIQADFNRDGKLDIATANFDFFRCAWHWLGNNPSPIRNSNHDCWRVRTNGGRFQ